MFNGKTHYKWLFSIAMLNYQRVKAWRLYGDTAHKAKSMLDPILEIPKMHVVHPGAAGSTNRRRKKIAIHQSPP